MPVVLLNGAGPPSFWFYELPEADAHELVRRALQSLVGAPGAGGAGAAAAGAGEGVLPPFRVQQQVGPLCAALAPPETPYVLAQTAGRGDSSTAQLLVPPSTCLHAHALPPFPSVPLTGHRAFPPPHCDRRSTIRTNNSSW